MYYYKKKQMWIFTNEEKQNAHNISTIDYLQRNYGLTFKPDGRGYRCREHNSLFVHADQKAWYWNSRGMGGGDVIEFVSKYENKSYVDALVQVINPSQSDTVSYMKAPEQTEPQERALLLPPKAQGQFKRVFAYLTKTRCIDPKIVDCLMHKKFIYEDARGNCVFVGYNKAGQPAYAALRSTKLVLGTFVVDCTKELDPMTEGMLKMMGVFSELERNMISQRVKSGLKNAKAKGKQLGRPATSTDDIPNVFYKHYPKYKNGEINKAEFARLCSLSYPTIFKYIGIVEGRE